MKILLLVMLLLISSVASSANLSVNSPCNLGADQTTCKVTVSWTMTEAPIGCLWLTNGQLFHCGGQVSSRDWDQTPIAGTTFILRAHQNWNSLLPTAPELTRVTAYAVVPPLVIPATHGNFSSFQAHPASGGVRVTYKFGIAATNQLYPADAHYFIRRLPSPANTFHTFWPYDNTQSTMNITNTIGEESTIKSGCQNGTSWVWLNRYINFQPTYTDINNIQTVKAIYSHGGKSWNITNVCGTQVGQPYAPYNVPDGGYRMQVWGYLYPTTHRIPFYWDWYARHDAAITNEHWIGTGSTTRPALYSEEAWWSDENAPWSGEMAPLTQPSAPGNWTGNWPTGRGAGGVGEAVRDRNGRVGLNAGGFWSYLDPTGTMARTRKLDAYNGPWPAANP